MTIDAIQWHQATCSCICCNTLLLAQREKGCCQSPIPPHAPPQNQRLQISIAGGSCNVDDIHNHLQAWSNGGYSDDLIVAAKCGENSLSILCPSFSVFPQWYVLDTDWICYPAPLRGLLK